MGSLGAELKPSASVSVSVSGAAGRGSESLIGAREFRADSSAVLNGPKCKETRLSRLKSGLGVWAFGKAGRFTYVASNCAEVSKASRFALPGLETLAFHFGCGNQGVA